MRRVILFIREHFNLVTFVVLQVCCVVMLFRYNSFHHTVLGNASNEWTGAINTRHDNLQQYFLLKKTNDALSKENARLRNLLAENFEGPDSVRRMLADSIMRLPITDSSAASSSGLPRKFEALPARVIGNSFSQPKNIIQIHRGRLQGVQNNMGVIGPDGIVGRVIEVGDNFSIVMSLLNRDNTVSAKLLKSGEVGYVTWEGNNPQELLLRDIPKSAQISKGDTVITSGYTTLYPKGLPVGRVVKVINDPSASSFQIVLRPATNFYTLQYVYVLNNLQTEELKQLEDKLKKKQ